MASMSTLCNELVDMVANNLHDVPDLAALALTCRGLFPVAQLELKLGASSQVSRFDGIRFEDRTKRPFKFSPLIWAAKQGRVGTLQKALAAGANPSHLHAGRLPGLRIPLPPSWQDDYGLDCWESGSVSSANPASDDDEKLSVFTALHVAVQGGSTEVVKLLLDHPQNLDCSNDPTIKWAKWPCCTAPRALTRAAEEPSKDLGGPETTTMRNRSALHLALCARRQENAQILISHSPEMLDDIFCEINRDGISRDEFTPFHLAAASGQLKALEAMTEQLINKKGVEDILGRPGDHTYSIDMRDGVGLRWCKYEVRASLLAEFCRLGRFEDACRLLDQPRVVVDRTTELCVTDLKQTDPSTPRRYNIPFLHLCCIVPLANSPRRSLAAQTRTDEGNQEEWRSILIKKLVDRGLDPNYLWGLGDDPGGTPLTVAARHGNLSAINALIDSGANVRIRNRKGRNALMAAITQRGKFDWPLDDTKSPSRSEFQDLWGLTSTLRPISVPRLCEVTKRLLEAGIERNEQDREGLTALHLFFHGPSSQPFVPTLLTLSESKLSRNRPLQVSNKEKDFLQLLLREGADPFVGCGIRHRSVLWTILGGLWFKAAGTVQAVHGPQIESYLAENPDQLRAMFFAVVKAHVDQPEPKGGLVDILEELLHLDVKKHLTTDRLMLQEVLDLGLAQRHRQWTRLVVTSLIGRMDIEKMGFDSLAIAELVQKAVRVGVWNLASRLERSPFLPIT